MNERHPLIILGGGPIGASIAWHLTERGHKVLLLTQEPTDDHVATYRYAGGSINDSYWADPRKAANTAETGRFIRSLLHTGVDLAGIENQYQFLDEGKCIDALNVSGAKLVEYFLDQAKAKGCLVQTSTQVTAIEERPEGVEIQTTQGKYLANQVIVALGAATTKFFPNLPIATEKRQLYVTDLPVDASRERWPHTIAKVGSGWVYAFVKKIGDGYKLVLGQEDLITYTNVWEAEDHFATVRDGATTVMPFLADAKLDKILWGFDVTHKLPLYHEVSPRILSVTCGSAVRSCVAIGRETADRISKITQ